MTYNQNRDPLAAALAVIEEDRLTPEQQKFDADYDAALIEDREWTHQAAQRVVKAQRKFFWEALAAAINAKGGRAVVAEDNVLVTSGRWQIKADRILSFWDFPKKIEVSTPDRRTHFKHQRFGGYNYERIAEHVMNFATRQARDADARVTREENANAVATVRSQLKLASHSYVVQASSVDELPIHVKVDISRAMTAEKAIEVLTFLKNAGLISDYNFVRE